MCEIHSQSNTKLSSKIYHMGYRDCRGFAFVTFSSKNEAEDAILELNNEEYEGRPLKVEKSKRNKGHESTPGKYLGHYKSSHRRRSYSPHSRYYSQCKF